MKIAKIQCLETSLLLVITGSSIMLVQFISSLYLFLEEIHAEQSERLKESPQSAHEDSILLTHGR